jgi:hypothetical protein
MKKIYIDIDGVLLISWQTQAALGAVQLIDYVIKHFDCYWLTSYCKGDNCPVLDFLSAYFDKETMGKFESVKATNWQTLKTDAIDLHSDFYWLDDHPMSAEIQLLREHGRLDSLIVVDLRRENELKRIIELLES